MCRGRHQELQRPGEITPSFPNRQTRPHSPSPESTPLSPPYPEHRAQLELSNKHTPSRPAPTPHLSYPINDRHASKCTYSTIPALASETSIIPKNHVMSAGGSTCTFFHVCCCFSCHTSTYTESCMPHISCILSFPSLPACVVESCFRKKEGWNVLSPCDTSWASVEIMEGEVD